MIPVYQRPPEVKKKKKGLLDALGPLAALAAGGAAIAGAVPSGGASLTALGALKGVGGALGAVQGGAGLVNSLKNEKPMEQGPAQLQTPAQRRVQTFQEDPNSILRQGLESLSMMPEPIRMEAGPVLLNAFMQGSKNARSAT